MAYLHPPNIGPTEIFSCRSCVTLVDVLDRALPDGFRNNEMELGRVVLVMSTQDQISVFVIVRTCVS